MGYHFKGQRYMKPWETEYEGVDGVWNIRCLDIGGGKTKILVERRPLSVVMQGKGIWSPEVENSMAVLHETNEIWDIIQRLRRAEGDVEVSGDELWMLSRFLCFDHFRTPYIQRAIRALGGNSGLNMGGEQLAEELLQVGTGPSDVFLHKLAVQFASGRWRILRAGESEVSFVLVSVEGADFVFDGEVVWWFPLDPYCAIQVVCDLGLFLRPLQGFDRGVGRIIRSVDIGVWDIVQINEKLLNMWHDESWQAVIHDWDTAWRVRRLLLMVGGESYTD